MKLPEPVAWQGVHDSTDLYYQKPPQADVHALHSESQVKELLAQADKDFSDGCMVVHLQVADQMKRRYEPVLRLALETIESIAMDRGLRTTTVEDEIRRVLG